LFFIFAGFNLFSLDLDFYGQYRVETKTIELPRTYGNDSVDSDFILVEPVHVSGGSYIHFDSLASVHSIFSIGNVQYNLPVTGKMSRFIFHIPEDSVVSRFALKSQERDVHFSELTVSDSFPESSGLTSVLFQKNKVTLLTEPDNFPLSLNFSSEKTEAEENIELTLTYHDGDEKYEIRTKAGNNPYWFYPEESERFPSEISIHINRAVLDHVDFAIDFPEEKALPIDLETLLFRKPSLWRREAYELYDWNDFPGMLIIDTADYRTQSLFFKRLAFFTEKKISVGELLSDQELEPLHGWNAHDYKAPDLARFFNKAARENFPLNERELELRKLLIANGVLKETSGRVRPGTGGILSISRESSPRLRELFLVHEGYHGIFFISEEFVTEVTEIWHSLTDEERHFWESFLDMYSYNISDEYLLINEFQAYLMQQEVARADSYFRGKINWMLSLKPQLAGEMRFLLENHGDTFSRSARLVEKSAYSLTGIKAGDLVLKRKK